MTILVYTGVCVKSLFTVVVLMLLAVCFAFDLSPLWPGLEAQKQEWHPFTVSLVLVFFAWFVHWRSMRFR